MGNSHNPSQTPPASEIEFSVVIPCLNESETLGSCLAKLGRALKIFKGQAEIIVADNGSVDESQLIARRAGARVVHVQDRGYGCCVMAGVEASRGKFLLLIDPDDRFDPDEFDRFAERLRDGVDLVLGRRSYHGSQGFRQGLLSRINRFFATPLFSLIIRRWFGVRSKDLFCGMRGFSRMAYDNWALRCAGLEFGVEMIVKAGLFQDRVEEIPVSYSPETRTARKPHLRSINDAWRALRFLLISCPRWMFLYPGLFTMLLGLFGGYAGYTNLTLFSLQFDVSTILLSGLLMILGYQAVLFAGFTAQFAINEEILPATPSAVWWSRRLNMERGFLLGMAMLAGGISFIISAWLLWRANDYGWMDNKLALRRMIPGVTLTSLGFQTILSGAFISILGMKRRSSQVQAPEKLDPEKPWLSVIMPVYQGGHHLDSALSSIAMQNDGGVEVIIVDDGSTDSAKEVVEVWGKVISLKVIWRDRVGNWVNNTNEGIRQARGEWICFLHQDDVWSQGRCSTMKQLIRKHPQIRFFFHPVNFINDKGWRIGKWTAPLVKHRELQPAEVLPRLIHQDFIGIMAPIFRKDLVEEAGLLDEDLWYHADWEYWLRLAAHGPLVYTPELLASFRIHELSQTSQRTSNLDDIANQIDQVVRKTLAFESFPEEKKKSTVRILRFHKTFYLYMLSVVHHKRQPTTLLIKSLLKVGPVNLLRYLHNSRLIERTLPRLAPSRKR